jgi:HD-GYP domain-containing protein (c-di-GMP phosphodiesterase class II)
MVNDTRLDSDYLTRNPRTDPGSELSLPILVAGSICGVMNLEQEKRGAFAEEDLLLAHVVASQVGGRSTAASWLPNWREPFLTTSASSPMRSSCRTAYAADHANEVADLATEVGRRLGIAGDELDRLRYGALLYDVGKIGVPARCCASRGR